jgi:phosphonate transport system ATP-binding protein
VAEFHDEGYRETAVSEQIQVSGAPIIVVNDLTKSYDGKINAIMEISLSIAKGEFTVLFGPSGVGKSTLLRCLNCLVEPTSGDVIVDGQQVGDMSNKELLALRSDVGMIFQEFNLINRMSVLVNVMCGRLHDMSFFRALTYTFSREDHEVAIHALRRAGLHDTELYTRRADTLSGGQKQRVSIARMLVQEPKIILADEPVASLDVKMQHTIMQLVRDIAARDGITVVMSLHQLELAKQYASRIIGLSEGVVAFDGPPQSLSNDVINRIFKIVDDKGVGSQDNESADAGNE